MKKSVFKLFDKFTNRSKSQKFQLTDIATELEKIDISLINHIIDKKYTMTSVQRLINTLKSCYYVVENNIPGDFVECGVWRGGNGILAKKVFEHLNSDKSVWMFDTFQGMTAPTSFDVEAMNQLSAQDKFLESQTETHNEWCYASLEDVQKNCLDAGLDVGSFSFIKGDVCETLETPQNIPDKISVLRLDTDWYESTKAELEILYPKLSNGGVLIIDDYGHWEGARKAVDEYFSLQKYKPLFNVIDRTGRSAIKIEK
ncbi:MAG: TylF/MycF/NovP-related O-methyltransferase [Paracoccaceae bacterium]